MTNFSRWLWSTSFLVTLLLNGCQFLSTKESAFTASQANQISSRQRITTVDVAIATEDNAVNSRNYIGTTEPSSTTVLRSQLEGRLLDLFVSVGDEVTKNQVVGRIDDSLLAATVEQERAELASLESELAKEKLNVTNAQISLQESQIKLEQAENDALRYSSLAKIGAISQQQAESFQTAAKVANQGVLLAEEAIKIARQTVVTARGRIAVQQAEIAEALQRQAYSELIAPTTGIVVRKEQEPGNLVGQGEDILAIGDFSAIKILVPISATDLNLVSLGKIVQVKFDAYPDLVFRGKVSKISPIANANTRKITVEIKLVNQNNQIKSGLLAKVQLPQKNQKQIIVPQSSIIKEKGIDYIFILNKENPKQRQGKVIKRSVQIRNLSQNKVIIQKGLESGEKYVIRSSQPLTNNEIVSLSILSE